MYKTLGVPFSDGLRYQAVRCPIVVRLKRRNKSWIQNECLREGVTDTQSNLRGIERSLHQCQLLKTSVHL